jgi:Protein of unknown function (DUF3689)
LLSSVVSLHLRGPHKFFRFAVANVIEEYLIGSATPLCSWAATLDLLPYLVRSLVRRRSPRVLDGHGPDSQGNADHDHHHADHDDDDDDIIECGNSQHHHVRSQTSFDILGELCKFNLLCIVWLDQELSDPTDLTTFCDRFSENVVESSLFVRSILLTMEWLDVDPSTALSRESEGCGEALSQCAVANFVWDERAKLAGRMLEEVTVSKVSQENICCVTTVLLFCRRVLRQGGEDGLIAFMEEVSSASVNPGRAPANAMELFCFWMHFYSFSANDSAALARSSGIPICVWTTFTNVCIRVLRDHYSLRVLTPGDLGTQVLGSDAICFDFE